MRTFVFITSIITIFSLSLFSVYGAGNVCEYSLDEVLGWLNGLSLSKYSESFVSEDIDGSVLCELETNDFREVLGMSLGHAKKIVREIGKSTGGSVGGETASTTTKRTGVHEPAFKDKAFGSQASSGGWGASSGSTGGSQQQTSSGGWGSTGGSQQQASSGGWGSTGGSQQQASSGGWGSTGGSQQASSGGWGSTGGSQQQASSGGWGASSGSQQQASSGGWGSTGGSQQQASSGGWGSTGGSQQTSSGGWGSTGGSQQQASSGGWGSTGGSQQQASSGGWDSGSSSGGWDSSATSGGWDSGATSGAWDSGSSGTVQIVSYDREKYSDGSDYEVPIVQVRIHKATDPDPSSVCCPQRDLNQCHKQNSVIVDKNVDFASNYASSSIAVIIPYSRSIESYAQYSEAVTVAWAKKWGYDVIMVELDENGLRPRHLIWDKVRLMQTYLPYYKYIMYMDADAMPTDHNNNWLNVLLTNFSDFDLLVCRDSAGIAVGGAYVNAGVMILKNSVWSTEFLIDWWIAGDIYPVYQQADVNIFLEQGALGQLLYDRTSDESWMSHVHVLPPYTFNNEDPFYKTHPQGKAPVLHLENYRTSVRDQVLGRVHEGFCQGLPFFGIDGYWMTQIVYDEAHVFTQTEPNNPQSWNHLASVLIDQQDYQGAIDSIQKAIQINPDEAFYWYALARALRMAGDLTQAVEIYAKVCQMVPFAARFHRSHADTLIQMGRWDEGVEVLKQAYYMNPESFEIAFALGTALMTAQGADRDTEEAAVFLERAVELNPKDADSWTNYATAIYSLGDMNEAIIGYQNAISLNPTESRSYLGLGRSYIAAGQFTEGIDTLESAVEMSPTSYVHWMYLGDGYRAINLFAEAMDVYDIADRLAPGTERIEKRISLVRDAMGGQTFGGQINNPRLDEPKRLAADKIAGVSDTTQGWGGTIQNRGGSNQFNQGQQQQAKPNDNELFGGNSKEKEEDGGWSFW